LFEWKWRARYKEDDNDDEEMKDEDEPKDERWRISQKHYFLQNHAKAKCVTFHQDSNLLVVGFSSGIFGLYEMPEFNMIHTLRFFSGLPRNHELSN